MTPFESALTFKQYQAAIFDLDGTLVHSEHAWEAAKLEVLARYGLVPSQRLLEAHVGRGLDGFLDEVFGYTLSLDQRNKIGNQIGEAADVLLPKMRRPVAGATDMLCALHEHEMQIAICSSSPRRHIVSALAELGIADRIITIVSAAELPKGKPDPLPYQATLSSLKLKPQAVCAFEDSLSGAQSACSAGISVFAVGKGCTGPKFSFCHKQAESFPNFVSSPKLHN